MEFEKELRLLGKNYSNVHFAKDVQIVYGASTATILVTLFLIELDERAVCDCLYAVDSRDGMVRQVRQQLGLLRASDGHRLSGDSFAQN